MHDIECTVRMIGGCGDADAPLAHKPPQVRACSCCLAGARLLPHLRCQQAAQQCGRQGAAAAAHFRQLRSQVRCRGQPAGINTQPGN